GMGGYGMGQMQQMGYNGYGAQQHAGPAAMNGAMGYGTPAAPGFESPHPDVEAGVDSEAQVAPGEEAAGVPKVEEGFEGDVDMAMAGIEGAYGGGFDPSFGMVPTGPGRGRGALRGRGVSTRGAAFAGRGGRGGAQIGIPRPPSPLPPGVPTGPRNPGPTAPARRDRSGYQDKDRQLPPANEGLDYGGGGASNSSPVRSRRESLPPRREPIPRRTSPSGEGGERERSSRSSKRETRERDRSDRDRDRERDREPRDRDREPRDRERERERERSREPRGDRERTLTPDRPSSSRRNSRRVESEEPRAGAGVDDFFPDKQAAVIKEEENVPQVVGIKIRGATKIQKVDEPAPEAEQEVSERRSRRGDREREPPTGPAADGRRDSEGKSRRSARGSGEDESATGRTSTRRSHRTEPDAEDVSERRSRRHATQTEEDEAYSRAAAEVEETRSTSRRTRRHHWEDDEEDEERTNGARDDIASLRLAGEVRGLISYISENLSFLRILQDGTDALCHNVLAQTDGLAKEARASLEELDVFYNAELDAQDQSLWSDEEDDVAEE
ncbi:hypothetical protein P7C70_g6440, partial [Phenoliferia sp. Uapishka_3]